MSQQKDNSSNTPRPTTRGALAPQQFVAAKLQKLGNVLYLLTSHFPDTEPLRREVRQRALDILSLSFKFISSADGSKGQEPHRVLTILAELRSFLDVARSANLLSEANVEVLKREIEGLASYIQSEEAFGAFFVREDDFAPEEGVVNTTFALPKGAAVSHSAPQQRDNHTVVQQRSEEKAARPSAPSRPGASAELSKAKKRRREAIIEVLKSKGEIGIKEIAAEVSGCSRKTIQRELGDLVDEGLLEKQGDRRWSTYRLLSPASV